MKSNISGAIVLSAIVLLAIVGIYTGAPVLKLNRLEAVVAKANAIKLAVNEFKSKYHALPGDLKNAGKALTDCPGPEGSDCNPFEKTAGDGIVGDKSFAKTWKPQVTDKTHVPAVSAADETVLFWSHLHFAGLVPEATGRGTVNALPAEIGSIYPEAPLRNTGFVVGYADGTLPADITFEDAKQKSTLKGTILLLVTNDALQGKTAMNTKGQLPLSPHEADVVDRYMDDGVPNTGNVQAYGNRDCVTWEMRKDPPVNSPSIYRYSENSTSRDCGLVFLIEPAKGKGK